MGRVSTCLAPTTPQPPRRPYRLPRQQLRGIGGAPSRLVLPQGPEPGAHLACEEFGLFPGGEVAALVDLVEVDEVGIGPLRPAARVLVLLAREDGRGDGGGDAFGVEEAALVLPVEASR